jgi:hypothetical protein
MSKKSSSPGKNGRVMTVVMHKVNEASGFDSDEQQEASIQKSSENIIS